MPAVAVVCDAGPLIHLHELGCLDLLGEFSTVLVPDTVWREVEAHRPGALRDKGVALRRVHPSHDEPSGLAALARVLGLNVKPCRWPRNRTPTSC